MTKALLLAGIAVVLGPSSANAEQAMKGWELYSWFDMACSTTPQLHSAPNPDSVCFALLPGTNREKTTEEIKKTPLAWAALEKQLGTLAKGDEVFWRAPRHPFDHPVAGRPTTDPRTRVAGVAKRFDLKLTIVK